MYIGCAQPWLKRESLELKSPRVIWRVLTGLAVAANSDAGIIGPEIQELTQPLPLILVAALVCKNTMDKHQIY